MSEKSSFLQRTIRFVYELSNTSRLIFIIGELGINVYHFKKDRFIESCFFSQEKINSTDTFHDFVKKYKNSDARIIINLKETNLQHEALPIIAGLNKLNPVDKYCETTLHPSDIYSYKTHSITNNVEDLWKAVILWTPNANLIEKSLFIINENRVSFAAIYFHEILSQNIAIQIAAENDVNLTGYIYSVVTVNEATGIRVTTNHGDNILNSVVSPYPTDKSTAYVQGVIEQTVSDAWLKLKAYTQQNELKKINIFIVTKDLEQLMSSQNYEVEKSIFKSTTDSSLYSDRVFIDYFLKIKRQPATSKELLSYYRFNLINNILFKPIYFILASLCVYCITTSFNIWVTESKISDIYTQYSNMNQEISLLGQNFPDINVVQLADLYNLQNKLTEPTPTPFDFAENLIKEIGDIANFSKISWELNNYQEKIPKFIFKISISRIAKDKTIKKLDDSLKNLQSKFPTLTITHTIQDYKDDVTNINKPMNIVINAIGVKK